MPKQSVGYAAKRGTVLVEIERICPCRTGVVGPYGRVMAHSINLGMPRIGPHRELKRAVERYWSGSVDAAELERVARAWRADAWRAQQAAGVDSIPSNDFSLYDQMLDTCCLVGAVPERFAWAGGAGDRGDTVDLDTYFAMARGTERDGTAVPPLEMTKWFDTNYHYLVPELGPDAAFRVASDKPVAELTEAAALGIATRPVLVGPVTFLLLAAGTEPGFSPLDLLPRCCRCTSECWPTWRRPAPRGCSSTSRAW